MTTCRTIGSAVALMLLLAVPEGRADEVARLPLGPPDRAYLLATGEPGQLVDARTGEVASFERAVEDLVAADVVVIGESHASPAGHEMQARLVHAIAKSGRPFALGLEFFESDDDEALARWGRGEIGGEEMLEQTGWYAGGAFSFESYRPMLEAARVAGAPVIGLNVPRDVVRAVSRKGHDALEPAQRERVGPLAEPDPRHRFLVDLMMGGLGASMPQAFDGMFAGQRAWDAAMAQAILRSREGVARDRLFVAIVGSGHASHGLGVPERLRALAKDLDVRVLVPAEAERPDPRAAVHPGFEARETATFSRGLADWVHVLPDEGGAEQWPRFGLALEDGKGGVRVASVEPLGVGARAGLRDGDELLAIGGAPVATVPAARRELARLLWGSRVALAIRRGGVERELGALVVPGTDGTDGEARWLESRPASALLDDFDPRSTRSYRDEPAAGRPHARLASLHAQPVRLDVLDGERLVQAWDLDAGARVVRGQFAEPAPDGAVRVEITRDASGGVTGERRFDASNAVIEAPEPPASEASAPPKG